MDAYQSRTYREHKQLLEQQGIEGFLRQIGSGGPSEDYIRTLSIALTHFCFRNGPVEAMHADLSIGLTEERMKTLNKYMVDKLGLFFLLLSVEDADAINSILGFHKQCGPQWDDPDLYGELMRHGISPERIWLMRKLLKGPEVNEDQQGSQKAPRATGSRSNAPDAPLKACSHCGSELVQLDAKTQLASFVDMSELRTNKRVAEAAGVNVRVVSELQHYNSEEMTGKLKEQAKAVADALGVPASVLYSFDPERSAVRCINCGASAPWIWWNTRFE